MNNKNLKLTHGIKLFHEVMKGKFRIKFCTRHIMFKEAFLEFEKYNLDVQ